MHLYQRGRRKTQRSLMSKSLTANCLSKVRKMKPINADNLFAGRLYIIDNAIRPDIMTKRMDAHSMEGF
jgi:hypothetical protein